MVSAGSYHSCFLCSDGTAVACGQRDYGQCEFPPLPEGERYTHVSAGLAHTVLLRSDGVAIICGSMSRPHHRVPVIEAVEAIETGTAIIQVAAGYHCTMLLQNDGTVIKHGPNPDDEHGPYISTLLPYINISQVSAGRNHTVFLCNDGSVFAEGEDMWGVCRIPALEQGLWYTQVSAGMFQTMLLCCDGSARSCGRCNVGGILEDKVYTDVSAGGDHSVLLRKDGTAVAVGGNPLRQTAREIPPANCVVRDGHLPSAIVVGGNPVRLTASNPPPECDEGLTYIDISAGLGYTLLLRNDGRAIALPATPQRQHNFGAHNYYGQCNVPALSDDVCFIPSFRPVDLVVHLHIQGATVSCAHALTGNEIASWTLAPADARIRVFRTVTQFVQPGGRRLAIVLQDGSLVTSQRWANIAWIL